MKVYQVNVVCGSGSTGRIAADLSHKISVNGGVCRIGYGRGSAPKHLDAFCNSKKNEVRSHALMTRITGKQGEFSKKATKRLIEDIKQFEPDIIHLHNIHGYYLNYPSLFQFLKEYEKPVVWTMHDCWAITGHCAHYESVSCDKWKKQCFDCPNLKAYPASYTGRNVAGNFKRKKELFSVLEQLIIVTPSMWLKEQIRHSFLKDIKVINIPNGIDLELFKPTESKIKEQLCPNGEKLLLGVTSVWTKNKGLNDFIKLSDIIGDGYVICLVGLSKKQIRQLPKSIVGIEKTESISQLAQYYTAADLFLNLTYEDTFPTTNIESIACGTPVLTYKTGGSPEIINEHCGFVVEKGDITGVKRIVTTQLQDKTYYENACLKRATEFQKEDCYQRYIELYEEILRSKKG